MYRHTGNRTVMRKNSGYICVSKQGQGFYSDNSRDTLPIHGNFLYFSTTSNHLHSQQVGNCDSNSRLVVDVDDNGEFRLERVIIAQVI